MDIQKIIPNPFDKESKLSDLAKKVELIREGLSFTVLLKNLIFLIILGVVLVAYFKISMSGFLGSFGNFFKRYFNKRYNFS